ncbi:xaa-Pro aminopeptidase 1 [Capsaspora owczarzaki ATCC 30864]|uniref:Xaa-Pro aminopeptidase 1 n=2 Tax=Capsaspora owczarzaki (strain ATCC 30864) TaxID=595528 RepID=A0A0D2VG60_CAPO3|nr:xaa-Pro aminopeptidase 1 [Capsaspora owczarzaki ATCC 30864]
MTSSAKDTTPLLADLRSLFSSPTVLGAGQAPIDAFWIPSEDAHQSEYIADCDNRRAFISNFTGSSGFAIVTRAEATLWTDGRYFLQAAQQLDANWTLKKLGLPDSEKQHEFLAKVLPAGSRVGCDPFLHSTLKYNKLRKDLQTVGLELVSVVANPVDMVWKDRPARPKNPVFALDETAYAGATVQSKVGEIKAKLTEQRAAAIVFSALDEIAWLFNLRGSDIECNPVFFSYAILHVEHGAFLFVDESRVESAAKQRLQTQGVTLLPYDAIASKVSEFAAGGQRVWIPNVCPQALASLVKKASQLKADSPVELAKAIKNATELEGMRQAHIRDGAALCGYFAWLENQLNSGNTSLTEVTAADKLEGFRRVQKDFFSLSFPTISSSGPNGAIIHYHPEAATCRSVSLAELYLCDSGAQYLDGTTDVTRTLHFGTPSAHQRECYTRVLKGNVQLSLAIFPVGATGQNLDVIARRPLWDIGLDYRHGTGHGVGSFLNVHEGPHRISAVSVADAVGLKPGMVVTNEPGYYEDGAFGIRIENVMAVVPHTARFNFGNRGYLRFETLTMAPLQSKLIVKELLTPEEVEWINAYHAEVREKVGSALKSAGDSLGYEWVMKETAAL